MQASTVRPRAGTSPSSGSAAAIAAATAAAAATWTALAADERSAACMEITPVAAATAAAASSWKSAIRDEAVTGAHKATEDVPPSPVTTERDEAWACDVPLEFFPTEARRKAYLRKGNHHLVYDTLWGGDKLKEYELWLSEDKSVLAARVLPGPELVGHPGIVHGGLTAAVADNLLGTIFGRAVQQMGFTANLTINYKSPWMADTPAVFVGRITKREGRKVFIDGYFRAADSNRVIATASSLFIIVRQPKTATAA